jgi:hypothetical protein
MMFESGHKRGILLQCPYHFDADFNDWLHKKLELNFVIVDVPFYV